MERHALLGPSARQRLECQPPLAFLAHMAVLKLDSMVGASCHLSLVNMHRATVQANSAPRLLDSCTACAHGPTLLLTLAHYLLLTSRKHSHQKIKAKLAGS